MPWEHCGKTIADDEKCPDCQITKKQWTLEWNVTREFQLKRRKGGLKFILQDADGDPIPDAAYECKLPDGATVKGSTDKHGSAKVDTQGQQGKCAVTFPGLKPESWEPKQNKTKTS